MPCRRTHMRPSRSRRSVRTSSSASSRAHLRGSQRTARTPTATHTRARHAPRRASHRPPPPHNAIRPGIRQRSVVRGTTTITQRRTSFRWPLSPDLPENLKALNSGAPRLRHSAESSAALASRTFEITIQTPRPSGRTLRGRERAASRVRHLTSPRRRSRCYRRCGNPRCTTRNRASRRPHLRPDRRTQSYRSIFSGRVSSYTLRGTHDSLVRQNERSEEEGLERIEDDDDLNDRIARGMLVPVPASAGLIVNPELPEIAATAAPGPPLSHRPRACPRGPVPHAARGQLRGAHRRVPEAADGDQRQRRPGRRRHRQPAPDRRHHRHRQVRPHAPRDRLDARPSARPQNAGKIDVEEEFQQPCFHITVYKSYVASTAVAQDAPRSASAPATADSGFHPDHSGCGSSRPTIDNPGPCHHCREIHSSSAPDGVQSRANTFPPVLTRTSARLLIGLRLDRLQSTGGLVALAPHQAKVVPNRLFSRGGIMSDQGVQPAAEVAPGLSQWQRVINIFTAPSKTFEDIKARQQKLVAAVSHYRALSATSSLRPSHSRSACSRWSTKPDSSQAQTGRADGQMRARAA